MIVKLFYKNIFKIKIFKGVFLSIILKNNTIIENRRYGRENRKYGKRLTILYEIVSQRNLYVFYSTINDEILKALSR